MCWIIFCIAFLDYRTNAWIQRSLNLINSLHYKIPFFECHFSDFDSTRLSPLRKIASTQRISVPLLHLLAIKYTPNAVIYRTLSACVSGKSALSPPIRKPPRWLSAFSRVVIKNNNWNTFLFEIFMKMNLRCVSTPLYMPEDCRELETKKKRTHSLNILRR